MATKPRTPGQTAISVSMLDTLVADIDDRARNLGLSRSKYLVQLAKNDLKKKGRLTLEDTSQAAPVPSLGKKISYRQHAPQGDALNETKR